MGGAHTRGLRWAAAVRAHANTQLQRMKYLAFSWLNVALVADEEHHWRMAWRQLVDVHKPRRQPFKSVPASNVKKEHDPMSAAIVSCRGCAIAVHASGVPLQKPKTATQCIVTSNIEGIHADALGGSHAGCAQSAAVRACRPRPRPSWCAPPRALIASPC